MSVDTLEPLLHVPGSVHLEEAFHMPFEFVRRACSAGDAPGGATEPVDRVATEPVGRVATEPVGRVRGKPLRRRAVVCRSSLPKSESAAVLYPASSPSAPVSECEEYLTSEASTSCNSADISSWDSGVTSFCETPADDGQEGTSGQVEEAESKDGVEANQFWPVSRRSNTSSRSRKETLDEDAKEGLRSSAFQLELRLAIISYNQRRAAGASMFKDRPQDCADERWKEEPSEASLSSETGLPSANTGVASDDAGNFAAKGRVRGKLTRNRAVVCSRV